jgi:xylulokinase
MTGVAMPSPELVLAVDLGTTCFKAALIDRGGTIRGLGRVTVEKDSEGDRCELPVERFWENLREAITQALQESGAGVEVIRALSYSSQANSFILLDSSQNPLTPLILWPDRRAAELPADPRLESLWGRPDFLLRTGLGIHGHEFCVPKLDWFRRQRPEIWAKCSYIQSLSDYLVFSLTGRRCGDQGTTALLGLWDLSRRTWWNEALLAAGFSPQQLSEPLPPGAQAGVTNAAARTHLRLPAGIPLAVGSLDHHAAAIGAGIRSSDVPSMSIGTVLACMRYQKELSPMPRCVLGPGTHGYPYYMLAFENSGTATIDRYHRRCHPTLPMGEMLASADAVPIGSNGLMVCPVEGRASEAFSGTLDFRKGEVVRAHMECSAASLLGLIERLYPDSMPNRVVATGGGTRSNVWLRLFADLCGIEFVVPRNGETACLGAGMLAALEAGWFSDILDVTTAWSSYSAVVEPDASRHAVYKQWINKYRAWVDKQCASGPAD